MHLGLRTQNIQPELDTHVWATFQATGVSIRVPGFECLRSFDEALAGAPAPSRRWFPIFRSKLKLAGLMKYLFHGMTMETAKLDDFHHMERVHP